MSKDATAMVGGDGRLVEAAGRLAELNARAGGGPGQPLAVPQLATLVRVAEQLGIGISRTVIAADGDQDLDLRVRAEPCDGGTRIEVTDWHARPAWQPAASELERDVDFFRASADWQWETDASLRITALPIDAGARFGFDSVAMLGQPLTRLFALVPDDEGNLPILDAIAAHARFDGQTAELRDSGLKVRLDATPRIDAGGRFTGFIGAARLLDDAPPGVGVANPQDSFGGFPDLLSQRLDRALRAPLGKIIANAEAIGARTEGPLKADYAGYAADIVDAGRHLLALVDDLVDLQAIEREDFVTLDEAIDLAEVARRAAGLLAMRAGQADVKIDRPRAGSAMPAIGEFKRALQVLVNLIGNAVRYSPVGGTVRIGLESGEGTARVIVADQGKGIGEADQQRIFDKFARVDPDEPGGSGLGLYIARRLARAMGGDIAVDSAPGAGARFIFTLPAREAPQTGPVASGA